jgi:hypothetical protein
LVVPLAVLLASRLALFLFSAVVYDLVPAVQWAGSWDPFPQRSWLNTWGRWDAGWYLYVAERGYSFVPDGRNGAAFFPLFPLLIRAATLLGLKSFVAGWLIANLALLAAGCLFFSLTAAKLGRAAAYRGLLWLTVFPYAFFFSAAYAESLYFLGAVGAFWAAERGRFGMAAVFGAVAGLTRPVGIVLFPALLALRLRTSRAPRDSLVLLAIPAMPALYLGYLWSVFGTPLAFFTSHSRGWNVTPGFHLVSSVGAAAAVALKGFTLGATDTLLAFLNVLLPVAFIGLLWPIFSRLGSAYGTFTALSLAITAIFVHDGMGRHLAVLFPVFMLAGLLDRGGAASDGLKLVSFTLQLLLFGLFATWRWVS